METWLSYIYDEEEDENRQWDKRLATAAVIMEEIRAAVRDETGFRCSAGIAHNKVFRK